MTRITQRMPVYVLQTQGQLEVLSPEGTLSVLVYVDHVELDCYWVVEAI
jgi:hypothetical protein